MPEQTSSIISKVWSLCNPLRDDGVSYGDYLEQLTYLIFLKMSDEYSKPPYEKDTGIPAGYTWQDMNALKGAELEEQYKKTLEELAKQNGLLGEIFKQATNKISNAAILYRVVQMIDRQIAAKAGQGCLHCSRSFLNAHHSKRKTNKAVK